MTDSGGHASFLAAFVASFVLAAAPLEAQECVGDCNDSGVVEINELIIGVNIALGSQPIEACPSFDCDDTGTVPINCLIQGVNNALVGCGGECPLTPGSYTITQVAGGTLRVGTLSPIPFPPGGSLVAEVAAATAPACTHDVVLPFPGGFQAPAFCIQAFGFTVRLNQRGCGVGQVYSMGGGDVGIEELGDTSSQPDCDNQQVCNPGVDDKIRVDVTVGDGTADTCTGGGTANAVMTVPVTTIAWLDGSMPAMCPSADGEYNPEVDTLILEVDQILDFTTDINNTEFTDLSGDGCALAGAGPMPGFGNTGSCWNLDEGTIGIAASGTVGSASPPLNDFAFTTVLPNTVTGPAASTGATCPDPPEINFAGTVVRCLE